MSDMELSLCQLLDPEVLANPYPLYKALREQDPVHWDPYLHAWVVTRYADVVHVLHKFSANRMPTTEQMSAMGCSELNPIAQMMVKQMLFMDGAAHVRLRSMAASAFTPVRVNALRSHIQEIADRLIDGIAQKGECDLIADFAERLPALVTAEMLGVPTSDYDQLKDWSAIFAEMLGNFHFNPDRGPAVLRAVEEMTLYFRATIREMEKNPCEGLVHTLMTAEIDGGRLTEEEVIANSVLLMVAGLETTTNLIATGMMTLLNHPDQLERLRANPSLLSSATEELLRFETPSHQTARVAPDDVMLGGKLIKKRQAVIAVLAACNRDPERFPNPETLDLARTDNRHVAFGFAAHFCLGAPLSRMEGQIAISTLLERLPNLRIEPGFKPVWRENLGLRGVKSLPVKFDKVTRVEPVLEVVNA